MVEQQHVLCTYKWRNLHQRLTYSVNHQTVLVCTVLPPLILPVRDFECL